MSMIHDLATHNIDIRAFMTGDEATSLGDWVAQHCAPSFLESPNFWGGVEVCGARGAAYD
jgi:hypothetical protein